METSKFSSRFLAAVQDLDQGGYPLLANSCVAFYDRQTRNMGVADRKRVLSMFDEILASAMSDTKPPTPVEIMTGGEEFVFLGAMAHQLRLLNLDRDIVEGFEILD